MFRTLGIAFRSSDGLPALLRPALHARQALGAAAKVAPLTTSTARLIKQLPPRPRPPPEEDFEEFFLKGSGPGGQKINKTSSAVQLRHKATGIIVKCQATRSREQNRKIARELLAARLDEINNGDQSRTALVGDKKKKKADSAAKKKRRKYKKLEEAKRGKGAADAEDADGDEEVEKIGEIEENDKPNTTDL